MDAPFYRITFDYSFVDWDGFSDHVRDVPWIDNFNNASATPFEFSEQIT